MSKQYITNTTGVEITGFSPRIIDGKLVKLIESVSVKTDDTKSHDEAFDILAAMPNDIKTNLEAVFVWVNTWNKAQWEL